MCDFVFNILRRWLFCDEVSEAETMLASLDYFEPSSLFALLERIRLCENTYVGNISEQLVKVYEKKSYLMYACPLGQLVARDTQHSDFRCRLDTDD